MIKIKNWPKKLYFWVLVGIFTGGIIGATFPEVGMSLKFLGDGFLSLIKMLIGPVIFCTIVLGIVGARDMRKVSRVGGKSLVYFEIISSIALVVGLIIANTLRPGSGLNIDPSHLVGSDVAEFTRPTTDHSIASFMALIIPQTFFEAFAGGGNLLQVLLIAVLFGYSMNQLGKKGELIQKFIEPTSHIFFGMVQTVMKLAPLGAAGAMAFTIGKYGTQSLWSLVYFMGCFYLTCLIFVIVVLGGIGHYLGFNIFRFILYIREELLMVLGTSSSESALVPLMGKLERLGCSKSVVGLVVPAGYSFNLDGTNIYLTLAIVFIAEALNIDLTLMDQLKILGVAMLTSKGASGVTGAGFVVLAATLAVVPTVPVAGLTLILGVDRFMSEARAITNMIGNGVATLVISFWEGELNRTTLHRELATTRLKMFK